MLTRFTNRGHSAIAYAFGTVIVGALTGCVSHVDRPHHDHGRVYAQPPSVTVVQDDYVYYPGHQVYYSSNRRQYVYQDGRTWVSRASPPRVSVDVLFASPSVRLDFHDSPEIHHARVVQQYPKHWVPPGSSPNYRQRTRDDGSGGR
jgi:hypothetical protein